MACVLSMKAEEDVAGNYRKQVALMGRSRL